MDYVRRIQSALRRRLSALHQSATNSPKTTSTTTPTKTAKSRRTKTKSSPHAVHKMQLTDLPYTVFVDIISYLPPRDALICRRISTATRQALTRNDLSISLILHHFPRSLEGRLLRRFLRDEDHEALAQGDWAAVFACLARRYFHLGNAMPWRTSKVQTLRDTNRLRGVTPWNRFLRLEGKTAPFHYWDPVWTFAPADGLLVYPAPLPKPDAAAPWMPYRARDVATGREFEVPFDVDGKVVRRIRLNDGILVVEWCEEEAYHALNAQEAAHRHFATAYDVKRLGQTTDILSLSSDAQEPAEWTISLRSEWKIHYLGLPLSHHDRFFSTHNSTHYVVYIWQPTRSPWGEENPLERLIIWELGQPSDYRPSEDPNEKAKPYTTSGPRIVRRLINEELGNWGIRQRDTPSLRGLALDECTWDKHTQSACGHVFFVEEEHRWAAGPHSNLSPPRLHCVQSTGIPLQGDGPRWLDACGGSGDDNVNMSFCWRGPRRRRQRQHQQQLAAGGGTTSSKASSEEDADEAWPGRAPCWRHDDFPYLTVSEVFDAAAGVRISARQCFMLETLSVHVRPRLRVEGVEPASPRHRKSSSRTSSSSSHSRRSFKRRDRYSGGDSDVDGGSPGSRRAGARAEGPDGEEVQFADEIWGELLGKGLISGDERWLVGEDGNGDITILEF